MLDIKIKGKGVSFPVKVVPRASKDSVAEVVQGAVKIRLSAPPVDGAANKALVKFLSKTLKVSKSQIKIISGDKSRNKLIQVESISADILTARLGLF